MPSDVRKLSDWLSRQPGPLQRALSHADQLSQATAALRNFLNEPWSDAVRFAALDGEVAVLFVSHAAAATLLRFRTPAVVAFVKERYNPGCTDLQIKVQPEVYAPK